MTSTDRLEQVRRMLDATPAHASALPAIRSPVPPAPLPAQAESVAPASPPVLAAPSRGVEHAVGWAAGLLAVAGIIHLTLLPGHLESARGTGLYFCAIGGAQVIWALLYVLKPTRRLAWVGLVALAVQPLAVYVLTRVLRQPFGDHAEAVDLIGILTGAMELGALGPFALFLARSRAAGVSAGRGVAVPLVAGIVAGLVFGVALYGAGLAAEELVPWLDEPEAPHTHGHVDAGAAALDASAEGAVAHTHQHT